LVDVCIENQLVLTERRPTVVVTEPGDVIHGRTCVLHESVQPRSVALALRDPCARADQQRRAHQQDRDTFHESLLSFPEGTVSSAAGNCIRASASLTMTLPPALVVATSLRSSTLCSSTGSVYSLGSSTAVSVQTVGPCGGTSRSPNSLRYRRGAIVIASLPSW